MGGGGRSSVCLHVCVCMFVCVHAGTYACVLEKRGMGEGEVRSSVQYHIQCFKSWERIEFEFI